MANTFSKLVDEWIREHRPDLIDRPRSTGPHTVSSVSTASQKISATPKADEIGPLDDLRGPFVDWFDAKIWLDAEWVARSERSPRWFTSVSTLYADFCGWMSDHRMAPPTDEQFRHLLEELCFEIRNVGRDQMVMNIASKDDLD